MHLFVVLGKGTMLKTLVRFGFVVACSVCLCALECVATPAACIKATRVCVCIYMCVCAALFAGEKRSIPRGVCCSETHRGARGQWKERGGGRPHLRMNL